MSASTEKLVSSWNGMTDRERRLVMLTAGVVVLFAIILLVVLTQSAIDKRARLVKDRKEQLAQIQSLQNKYKDAEEEEKSAIRRLTSNNVSLFSLLNTTSEKLGLKLNDLNERKIPVKDSEVTEVSVEVNLKDVSIDKFISFVEDIEGKSRTGLVKITKLKVKTRFDNAEMLDVNMTVATWTQKT